MLLPPPPPVQPPPPVPVQTPPPQPTAPYLTGATVTFVTGDDDKDVDTALIVFLQYYPMRSSDNGNFQDYSNYYAYVEDYYTASSQNYRDGSTHSVDLTVNGQPLLTAVRTCWFTVGILPTGHDTWVFKPTLHLEFSDGSTADLNSNNYITLDQNTNFVNIPTMGGQYNYANVGYSNSDPFGR